LKRLFRRDCPIPVQVADGERIVRAICSPYHFKKNKVDVRAFDPTPGTDEISVSRLEYLGADVCKKRAQLLNDPSQQKKYVGLSVLRTAVIREHGMDVIDSRHVFCGHADIKLGLPALSTDFVPGEPLTPELKLKQRDLGRLLLQSQKYHADPEPDSQHWTGTELMPPDQA
jgi:hypothetical protein